MFLSKLRAFLPKHKGTYFLILIALLLLGATVVYASGEGEVINACVGYGGRIRIVQCVDVCSWRESGLWWNQEGLQGPQGPQGPVGPAGPVMSFYTKDYYRDCNTGVNSCQAKMSCDSGDIPISGGYIYAASRIELFVSENRPYPGGWWYVTRVNENDDGLISTSLHMLFVPIIHQNIFHCPNFSGGFY